MRPPLKDKRQASAANGILGDASGRVSPRSGSIGLFSPPERICLHSRSRPLGPEPAAVCALFIMRAVLAGRLHRGEPAGPFGSRDGQLSHSMARRVPAMWRGPFAELK